ncbi:hypothetical protein A3H03_01510 [Candidatus Kuenenbacteria bacterium RIFCSPLOWO2_12_FULL_42_13]|uniref:Transcriptional regulator of heat shock protein n=5 Tax=Candidatus Kueneniibacteriota TaxID=1752740 RepID=A0A0G1B1L4_9BACT|nr:MAG: Transcriptional regulator of heat shock protein [Candidatus Kuenenbacteria bacterium GW2011_GWA2_42_15]OGG91392.1 MAG: hypothetical protein A3H55_02105 [Candidatus Kuenenbacteria bacterium RIFCSPLOWO2_02_FULL_42_16]OGG92441.1 MAG: hypothetical protein A3H03_01510 [Candidatus Kuenenbacteria bacterium RIFCSPLOWO2_12_FULL_42_13]OGG95656.1 MAG: hypothetical protein A2V95_00970 [Candidatus Kuenenbacteria bacterium RBG_16_41_7]OGG98960.1 MAG: hypothetical protein A3E04_04050 [Candidatus Kuene
MNDRQKELFHNIVLEHITTAKAIGSEFLVKKYNLEVSSATTRNDMAELEAEGLIYQPHTSAGRVPTERGYNYYVANYLSKNPAVGERDKKILEQAKESGGQPSGAGAEKMLAKAVAELADTAVVYCPSKNNTYYTGLSNLLSQPEFADFNLIYRLTEVVDNFDEVLDGLYDKIKDIEIKIGKDNAFSSDCASILTKKSGKVFGLIGPMRMDYERNLGLVTFVRELLN